LLVNVYSSGEYSSLRSCSTLKLLKEKGGKIVLVEAACKASEKAFATLKKINTKRLED
jgi:hypothetical protein